MVPDKQQQFHEGADMAPRRGSGIGWGFVMGAVALVLAVSVGVLSLEAWLLRVAVEGATSFELAVGPSLAIVLLVQIVLGIFASGRKS